MVVVDVAWCRALALVDEWELCFLAALAVTCVEVVAVAAGVVAAAREAAATCAWEWLSSLIRLASSLLEERPTATPTATATGMTASITAAPRPVPRRGRAAAEEDDATRALLRARAVAALK